LECWGRGKRGRAFFGCLRTACLLACFLLHSIPQSKCLGRRNGCMCVCFTTRLVFYGADLLPFLELLIHTRTLSLSHTHTQTKKNYTHTYFLSPDFYFCYNFFLFFCDQRVARYWNNIKTNFRMEFFSLSFFRFSAEKK